MSFRTQPFANFWQRDKQSLFTAEIRTAIDAMIAKYPPAWRQSAVMPALMLLQDEDGGWLTRERLEQVAIYLDMPMVAVYEVATFYGMYDLVPQGRHKICICKSVSCFLRGSQNLIDHLAVKYKVHCGETTPDNRFTVKEVECIGACRHAPAVLLDKTCYEDLSPAKLDSLIDELK